MIKYNSVVISSYCQYIRVQGSLQRKDENERILQRDGRSLCSHLTPSRHTTLKCSAMIVYGHLKGNPCRRESCLSFQSRVSLFKIEGLQFSTYAQTLCTLLLSYLDTQHNQYCLPIPCCPNRRIHSRDCSAPWVPSSSGVSSLSCLLRTRPLRPLPHLHSSLRPR